MISLWLVSAFDARFLDGKCDLFSVGTYRIDASLSSSLSSLAGFLTFLTKRLKSLVMRGFNKNNQC
jgi:hypothetical protein